MFAREKMDCTLRGPGDVSYHLNLPELGAVPISDSSRPSTHRRKAVLRVRIKFGPYEGPIMRRRKAKTHRHRRSADDIERVTWLQKPSAPAESFRATLASILLTGRNGNRPRVLVVTSPSPGEGKTTVTSNLAIAMAEIHQRVLLVDADMRNPRLHQIFDTPNHFGLSSLLQHRESIGPYSLESIAYDTDVPGLYILPSGPPAPAASNLLHSRRAPELLEWARKEFDFVLIDTPPMIQIPDARMLGPMADAILLVLRAGQTTRDIAKAAVERLFEDGTPLLGTVLNGWDPVLNGYGHYEAYGYPRRRPADSEPTELGESINNARPLSVGPLTK